MRRKLMRQTAINKRIIKEIDALKVDPRINDFLKELLEIELDNLDKAKAQYIDEYSEKLNGKFGF
jgi:uncharacterized membrane protein YheB (UPF0754 family)